VRQRQSPSINRETPAYENVKSKQQARNVILVYDGVSGPKSLTLTGAIDITQRHGNPLTGGLTIIRFLSHSQPL
jgi:hypothetical protein